MDVGGDDPDQQLELEHSVQYLAAVKATLPLEDYGNFLNTIDTFRKKRRWDYVWLRANVKEHLKDFKFLTRGFNVFLPKEFRIDVPTAKSVSIDLPTACRFLHKIKRCLTGSNQILDSFLHIIQNSGNNNGKCLNEIYREVAFCLQNDPELIKEFTQLFPHSLKPTASVSCSSEWKNVIQLMSSAVEETKEFPESVWTTELLKICHKMKQQVNAQDYKKFLDYLKSYNNGRLSSIDLLCLVRNMLVDNPALIEELNDFIAAESKHQKLRSKPGENGRFIREGTALGHMSVKDINFSRCFSCTPSYKLLPESYLNLEASNWSEADKEVLNDRWVSIASGKQNCSNGPESNNPYADKLFKCDDDMYEMEMLLKNLTSVISHTEILLRKINDPSGNIKIPIELEDHFRAMNIRCIQQVYGNYGDDVLEAIKQNPHNSLPVLLKRMNNQREEWLCQRSQYSKIWSKVKQENYHKSHNPLIVTKKRARKKIISKAVVTGTKEVTGKKVAFSASEQKMSYPMTRNKKRSLGVETSPPGRILTKWLNTGDDLDQAQINRNESVKKWARRTFFSG